MIWIDCILVILKDYGSNQLVMKHTVNNLITGFKSMLNFE